MNHPVHHLLLTRPGFEDALAEEAAVPASGGFAAKRVGNGLLQVTGTTELPARPLVFERQRLPVCGFIPNEQLKPITLETAASVFKPLLQQDTPWILHALTEEEGPELLKKRIKGITAALIRMAMKQDPRLGAFQRKAIRNSDVTVVQCLLTERGLWHAAAPASTLTRPMPAGRIRMKRDPGAPSRSYLKVEEALSRMGLEPQPGQKVIDLGAAPGGWTYSFLKRGCDVMAVDRGPMKLPEPTTAWGQFEHRREDGIGFEPPRSWRPVDFLVSDMLIAPGVALGLLRNWLKNRWMKNIICNIKIPQQHPYVAVKPVVDLLERQQGIGWSVSQLYHDRREVTVMVKL